MYGHEQSIELDAMGNRANTLDESGSNDNREFEFYEAGTARLAKQVPTSLDAPDSTFNVYDEMGNLLQASRNTYYTNWTDPLGQLNWWMRLDYEKVNLYDDSNQLISHSFTFDTVAQVFTPHHGPYEATETYQYDALGRRIRYRSIKGNTCYAIEPTSGCHSTITRVFWDGNQILGEIRGSGDSAATASTLEDDAPGRVGPNYGAVLYVYGPELDVPLEIIKDEADTVLPVIDYRGALVTGTCPTSACQTTQLVFAQSSEGIFGGDVQYFNGLPSWYGTLLDGQKDASGYNYRRNRYLDPATGRFTQEDPIGLAGGLNVYGYANGDPITYSDPFGLCVPKWLCDFSSSANAGYHYYLRTLGLEKGSAVIPSDISSVRGFALGELTAGLVLAVPTARAFSSGAAGAVEAEGGAAAGEAGDVTTTRTVTRGAPGRDGATSRHLMEEDANGTTRSVTHQVERNGEVVHQHQTHVGKYGGRRQFPDDWVNHPRIDKP